MEVDIMPLGNSVTKGGQPPDNTYGYRNHLSNGLIDAGYSFRFVGSQGTGALQHEGHSGYHADGGPYGGIATNVFDWLVDNPADVVLLHIGTNDLTAGQLPAGLDGVADDVDAILNEIDAYENDPIGNDVWVILAQIINRADEYSDRTTELNGLIKDLADARRAVGDRIVVVDMENALNYPDDLYHSINEEDVVHPNDAGYYKMAQVWFAALDDALDYMFEVGVFDVALTQDAARGELTCSYALGTEAETAATAWYKGTSPIMAVYLPMEGGADNSLLDYSGNGLAVTKTGDPLWSPAADPDGHGAYAFDGNDGLTAGENFPTSASYTKTAWVYRTGSGSDGVNSIISGDASSGGHRFSAPDGSGNILSAGHNGTWTAVEDSEALASDTWYFVAVTYDAASDTMTLYKNGLAVDSATVSDDVTDATIFIGSTGAASGGWQGFIDDVRIYPHALSPQQIESLYLNGKDIVVSQETATGEEWECEVTPFSNIAGGEAGDTRGSNPLIYEARADADGDGDVDGDDLQLLIQSFNTTSVDLDFNPDCDFNLDDRVDAEDLDIFAGEFGDAPAAAPLAVSLSTTSTLSTNTLETETRANEPVRGKSDLASGAKKRGKKRLASSCLGCVTEC
jgi:lysophospholipase L1-like esterase